MIKLIAYIQRSLKLQLLLGGVLLDAAIIQEMFYGLDTFTVLTYATAAAFGINSIVRLTLKTK